MNCGEQKAITTEEKLKQMLTSVANMTARQKNQQIDRHRDTRQLNLQYQTTISIHCQAYNLTNRLQKKLQQLLLLDQGIQRKKCYSWWLKIIIRNGSRGSSSNKKNFNIYLLSHSYLLAAIDAFYYHQQQHSTTS